MATYTQCYNQADIEESLLFPTHGRNLWDTKATGLKEVIGNKLYKFDAGFFSSGKAAGSVDTGGINGFWQRGMMEKRQAKCKGYFQALTK